MLLRRKIRLLEEANIKLRALLSKHNIETKERQEKWKK
jgi:hypothetical protein